MDKLLLGWRILVRGDERKLTNMAATQFRVAANILLYRFSEDRLYSSIREVCCTLLSC